MSDAPPRPRPWDVVYVNARLATMQGGGAPYGAIDSGAIAVQGDCIAFVGPDAALPSSAAKCAERVVDCGGAWITPGLVDCHTHVVFGGNRAHEFEMRLNGATYEEIARAGGGIRSTVAATRSASEDELYSSAKRRLVALMADGVTTVEIKSGYGLTTPDELKMLRVARRLGADLPITVRATFLGAHALPIEYQGRQADYVRLVCDEMIPAVAKAGVADAIDAFCETIAFTPAETDAVFTAARTHGLPVKLHADQLSDLGGAALAARHHALSADHLEYTSEAGVRAMAVAGTVAVLLPGAFYFLRETKLPPIDLFRRTGVPIALASDCNPGSSPALSLPLILNMACVLFRLSPEEAIAGVTVQAARALGLTDRGVLAVGKRADFALWDVEEPAELCYWLGGDRCKSVVVGGKERVSA